MFEKIVTKDISNLRDELYKVFATKEDISKLDLKIAKTKSDLIKSIYIVGLIQFIAIVGSVIGIISFMMRK